MALTTLIDTATLAARLDDSSFAIVDCRFRLDDVAWGEREYGAHHIPGAVYAHLDRDLSGPATGTNGRHPLPDPTTAAKTFGRLGIGPTTQVIVYDQNTGMYAARVWWMLRWLGHDAVAVLDGGFDKWTAEGRPAAAGSEAREPAAFVARPRPDMVVDVAGVASAATRPDWRVVDARAPERYRGEVEPIDNVAGHIPGAINYPLTRNLGADGTFLPAAQLAAQLRRTIGGTPADHVVCYCGSGVSACHNILALERAGLGGARLYVGSWSEWSSDPSRPIGRGTEEK